VNPCFLLDEVEYPIERPATPPSQRNLEIYRRYIAGERAVDLATEYGISWQRIYQIIEQVDDIAVSYLSRLEHKPAKHLSRQQ
jgi:hypothetical protein